ncbi:MAG TPA: SMC-Scp complex subunit ScpB [Actinomycetota bacterium]
MSELRRILEAILFVATDPVPLTVLAQITEESRDKVRGELDVLAAELVEGGRGVILREVGAGFRLYTSPDAAAHVERFVMAVQQPRLTQAALEVLAIIAYKQPITRQQIASIRGVDSDGVVNTLEARGLVVEVGRDPGPGQAILYGTSGRFLERLGLRTLDELPPIADLLPPAAVADELEP